MKVRATLAGGTRPIKPDSRLAAPLSSRYGTGAMNSPAAQKTSGLAITGFVFGLLSLCCPFFLASLVAIICGHIARGKIKRAEPPLDGGGLAMAGLILGYLSIALWIVAWIFGAAFGGRFAVVTLDAIDAKRIHGAMVQMVSDGETKGDKSLGWPADSGITTVTELKKRLVDNGYLSKDVAESLRFDNLEFGNVSASDPAETVFIKFRNEIIPGQWLYLSKDGEEGGPTNGDTNDVPPRTPPYLAP